jgi:hypothetical protein
MDNVQKHNICTNVPLSQTFDLILFKSVFLNMFNLYSSLQMRDQVSCPYKTIPNNIVLYIVCFVLYMCGLCVIQVPFVCS